MALVQGAKGWWKSTIGLEIHCQIKSVTKLFSNAPLPQLKSHQNSCVSLFDVATPGTLPVLNEECVRQALTAVLALNCKVNRVSHFERKHYYYQDLPLGYQITQQDRPIGGSGFLEFYTNVRDKNNNNAVPQKVGITRVQMEQDSGKSLHDRLADTTCVDLNRAGQGLLEIVFEPDLHSAAEAAAVVKTVQQLVRHIGVCDANMEDGSLRVDVNVSVATAGQRGPDSIVGDRVEVKNLNSVQRIMAAIDHEVHRHVSILQEEGGRIEKETRGFDATTGNTHRLRSKETAVDYRFMPDPDLPPLELDDAFVTSVKAALPETPEATAERLVATMGLTEEQIQLLIMQESVFFFDAVLAANSALDPIKAFFWVTTVLQGHLKAAGCEIKKGRVSAPDAAEMLAKLADGSLTPAQGRDVLVELCLEENRGRTLAEILVEQGLDLQGEAGNSGLSTTDLTDLCEQVVSAEGNRKQVAKYKAGKKGVLKYFVGEVMRATRGVADPKDTEAVMARVLDAT
jgi:aspartyl-tRNA(Asn)/glutamyl-tRNA(Gln) amidotransferase subunit B